MFKINRTKIALSAASMLIALSTVAQDPLVTFRWENRLILVESRGDASFEKRLRKEQDHMIERQIVWFVMGKNAIATNFNEELPDDFVTQLKRRYFNSGGEQVVLIGKDGGVKLRANSLDLPDVFGRIDSMPMRQREIRQKASNGEK